jgi:tRNA A-37 threonylcarbamoyl transferase component Bud32
VSNILSCPSCAAVIVPEESGGVCPQCHTPVTPSDVDVTVAAVTTKTAWLSASGAIDHGRFAPGSLLGGRYRIIERRGRGGMGEVYRADDLKLGQPVALKFLPADVDRDPARLTQLHTEVRMARQVSHPNVCRVYDIDEVDGHTFLSMEYVDGEDVASLLRRVGRFSEDRGLEIARQICAGLAAAHERDVVHRDLKPPNVMLDGAGKVRITDFGLAGITGEAVRAGTPAYMAPEQLAGHQVTARSDIYSLGLVLYEIFTGQRALDGKNLAELIQKREHSGIVPPTAIVKALDPKIEAAIMRCLRPEPEGRPQSALAVAAALPGGDPLAAALAAGETPSPDMVAAAGRTDALHPAIAFSLLAVIVVGLVAFAAINDRQLVYSKLPMQRSLDSLTDRAREIVVSLGYPESPADYVRGISVNSEYLSYIARTDRSKTRWDGLAKTDVPVRLFWYRSSRAALVPLAPEWSPNRTDPPVTSAGMTLVMLDDRGQLILFLGVPPRTDKLAATPAADPWPRLFAAAGLSMSAFKPVPPEWVPTVFADQRAAWEGPIREGSSTRIRVEAASFHSTPVSFRIIGAWTPEPSASAASSGSSVGRTAVEVTVVLLLLGTIALARHNLRAGRGDRRGASRVSLFILGVWAVAWLIGARHYSDFVVEVEHLFTSLSLSLFNVSILWLFYLAIEPYVRRFWPRVLVTWSRVLAGQFIDVNVGREVLIGVALGVALALAGHMFSLLPWWFGDPPAVPRAANTNFLLGTRFAISQLLRYIPNAVQSAMLLAVVFVLGRVLLRGTWGGFVTCTLVFGIFILNEEAADHAIAATVLAVIMVAPLVATFIYFGLLSVAVMFLVNQALNNAPILLDWSHPDAGGSIWVIVLILGLALFGVYSARNGQPLFGRVLQTD